MSSSLFRKKRASLYLVLVCILIGVSFTGCKNKKIEDVEQTDKNMNYDNGDNSNEPEDDGEIKEGNPEEKPKEDDINSDTSNDDTLQGDESLENSDLVGGSNSQVEEGQNGLSTEEKNGNEYNGFMSVLEYPNSTVSIDIDTSSYKVIKNKLMNGESVSADEVQIEEMINYFDYGYNESSENKPLSIYTELSYPRWNKNHRLLQIGIIGGSSTSNKNSIVASDVNIEIEFNPAMVKSYRLIGYENKEMKTENLSTDTSNSNGYSSNLYNGDKITFLYEIELSDVKHNVPDTGKVSSNFTGEEASTYLFITANYKERTEKEYTQTKVPIEFDLYDSGMSSKMTFASSVAAVGMILNDSPYKGDATYDMVLDMLSSYEKSYDTDKLEFIAMVKQLRDRQQNSEKEQAIYYGEWLINQVQAYGIGTYGEGDVADILSKQMIYTEDEATYFGDKIDDIGILLQNPLYSRIEYTEQEFVELYRIPTENLNLSGDSIIEIQITNAKGHINTLFIRDENTLIALAGGTFFELTRIMK